MQAPVAHDAAGFPAHWAVAKRTQSPRGCINRFNRIGSLGERLLHRLGDGVRAGLNIHLFAVVREASNAAELIDQLVCIDTRPERRRNRPACGLRLGRTPACLTQVGEYFAEPGIVTIDRHEQRPAPHAELGSFSLSDPWPSPGDPRSQGTCLGTWLGERLPFARALPVRSDPLAPKLKRHAEHPVDVSDGGLRRQVTAPGRP